jgi:hypothetical protein
MKHRITIPESKYWSPVFDNELDDFECPIIGSRIFNHQTLKKGSSLPICLKEHEWSQTSSHLIVFNCTLPFSEKGILPICDIVLPARIVGRLLAWLRDQPMSPRYPWWRIGFWIHRTENDEWFWFTDDSPESYSFLPWKNKDGEVIAAEIMNS